MMPDFPSATGTLSSWRERKQEGGRDGREGQGRRGSWSGFQQLVTSFLSQKAYLGAKRSCRKKEHKDGFSLQESKGGRKKIRCEMVCLRRCWRLRSGEGWRPEQQGVEDREMSAMLMDGWMDDSF